MGEAAINYEKAMNYIHIYETKSDQLSDEFERDLYKDIKWELLNEANSYKFDRYYDLDKIGIFVHAG